MIKKDEAFVIDVETIPIINFSMKYMFEGIATSHCQRLEGKNVRRIQSKFYK